MNQELLSKVTSRKLREALLNCFSQERETKERGIREMLNLSGFNPWDAQLLQTYGVMAELAGPNEKLPDQSQETRAASAPTQVKSKAKSKAKPKERP